MSVLGIDPSLRCTGIALVTRGGDVVASRFPTKPAGTLAEQQEQVRYIVGSVLRAVPMTLDLTVIEEPYVPQHAAGEVVVRSWVYGLLVDQLMQRGPVAKVSAKTRAKYAAHNGNADKKAVEAAIREAFPNIPIRDNNEADAIALAAMGARYLGVPADGTPSKKQLEAMTAVVWPVIGRKN